MCPVFLRLGNFVIYWYGVMVASGVFIAGLIMQKNAYRRGYSPELVSKLIFWTVVWGIIGGRLFHVVAQMPYYYRNPIAIFSIRNGGLAISGSIITGLLFIAVYSKIRNFHLAKMLDIMALPVPLAQAIGRVGCFLNGCCYGKATDSFLGVQFPHLETRVHPVQLYYSAVYILFFFILNALYKKRLNPGMVFITYILGFGFIRYIIDMLRGEMFSTFLGLYPTQVVGVVVFLTGAIWFLLLPKDKPGERE